MTSNTHLVRRFLQGIAFAAMMDATAFAQSDARPVMMPQPQSGVLAQPTVTYTPDPRVLTELAGDTSAIAQRPESRLTFAGPDGLHVSFVTPTAGRESEQLRVQSSIAILSAFISQRNAPRAAHGPAARPGPARRDASDSGR